MAAGCDQPGTSYGMQKLQKLGFFALDYVSQSSTAKVTFSERADTERILELQALLKEV